MYVLLIVKNNPHVTGSTLYGSEMVDNLYFKGLPMMGSTLYGVVKRLSNFYYRKLWLDQHYIAMKGSGNLYYKDPYIMESTSSSVVKGLRNLYYKFPCMMGSTPHSTVKRLGNLCYKSSRMMGSISLGAVKRPINLHHKGPHTIVITPYSGEGIKQSPLWGFMHDGINLHGVVKEPDNLYYKVPA